ncbi:SLC13 family permease [Pseudalkalibacillus berkeleyi]|uniref:SLC13 family permease n=1 Tax=Pseudalkalibacillus berkeleyi TaxID=1069813 RepID=A0ABS9GZD3_9BACL|nr:SLC13 family permease [Pseudalkalibacillus berkeleyi]MCF6136897.1 SLC13 family permease [Pseudalkalibacillus berkeleyi]
MMEIWITYTVIGFMFLFLIANWYSAEVVILSAVIILIWSGILTIPEAFNGFINEGVLTIASLFVIMNTLQKHPAFIKITKIIFGNKQTLKSGLVRMMAVTGAFSSLMNNTPLVILLTPIVKKWSDKYNIYPSKLLIPLSYAAIIGGMCTLLGTSTNLVVHTLLQKEGYDGFSLFELSFIGIPFFVIALIYMITFGHKLLPERVSIHMDDLQSTQFNVQAIVNDSFPWIGKSIEQAGLRHLKQSYVMAILRQGEFIFPVTPDQKICLNDHLLLVGDQLSADELKRFEGLSIQASNFEIGGQGSEFKLLEATIPLHSAFISLSIKEIGFRAKYGGVVVAVYRNGLRMNGKVGSIRLKAGDMLYILTTKDTVQYERLERNLLLLSTYTPEKEVKMRDWIPVILFGLMISVVTFGLVQVAQAAITTALLLLILRSTTFNDAKDSIKWDVLFIIGGAFGIAEAMIKTGAAQYLSNVLLRSLDQLTPFFLLLLIYVITNLLTELITNNAAAVIMFPIAMSFVQELSLNPEPYAVAIAIAASASFSTPIGYQTNLLVYSTGQYRFNDFIKVGIPLNILGLIISIMIIPFVWPLN